MIAHKDKEKFLQNVIDIGDYTSETAKVKEDIRSEQLLKIVPEER